MNCTNHQDWLQAHLDGSPAADQAAAEEHRASCAACRALFAAAQRLLEVVRLVPSPAPPEGLQDRIVCGVLADRRRTLRFRRMAVATTLAATVLLAVWLALPYFRPAAVQNNVNQVVGGPKTPDPKLPEPSLEESLQEATTAVVEITRRTTEETVGQTRLLTALVPEMPVPAAQSLIAVTAPAVPLRELQDSVSDGLEPVASSWRRAVDLFRRNIPPMAPAGE